MNLHAFLPRRAAAFAFGVVSFASAAMAEDGAAVQAVDAVWNLHDQLQDTVRKSVKGYIEASQDGPPPDNGGKPFDLDYLQQIKQKNEGLVNTLNTLKANQQKLLELDTKLLQQLPPNDPRRGQIEAERNTVANGINNTVKKRDEFKDALAESNHAVDKWNYGHGLTNEPPKPVKRKPPPESAQNTGGDDSGPSGPAGPTAPTGPSDPGPWTGGGAPPAPPPPVVTGGGGGNVDAWKMKEAQLETDARNLGKMREQAVIDYLNDPSDENKAKAAALKGQLDGLVNKLNRVRGKVDGLTGGSRPPLRVRTAKQIKNKWQQGGMTAGSGEDHHHGADGTDMSGGSEGHHHAADGSDTPYKTVSEGPNTGGGTTAATTGKKSGKRRRAAAVAATSSEGHHHGANGMDMPNNQAQGQGGGGRRAGKRRMATQQSQQTQQVQQTTQQNSAYNLATNQNRVQNPNQQQQRRRKKQRGY